MRPFSILVRRRFSFIPCLYLWYRFQSSRRFRLDAFIDASLHASFKIYNWQREIEGEASLRRPIVFDYR